MPEIEWGGPVYPALHRAWKAAFGDAYDGAIGPQDAPRLLVGDEVTLADLQAVAVRVNLNDPDYQTVKRSTNPLQGSEDTWLSRKIQPLW